MKKNQILYTAILIGMPLLFSCHRDNNINSDSTGNNIRTDSASTVTNADNSQAHGQASNEQMTDSSTNGDSSNYQK
jgi:hypothetical protein